MLHPPNSKKNRFAWLTPLNTQTSTNGPWVLASNQTQQYADSDKVDCRKITIDSLLSLGCSVLSIPAERIATTTKNTWTSACGRFRIEWIRQQSDASRLFVQKAEDYFARIELFMDNALLVAFHEPVWPHLQRPTQQTSERLSVPSEYLNALQNYKPEQKTTLSGKPDNDDSATTRAA